MDKALIVTQDAPLAPMTTLRVGGTARFFVSAASREGVASAVGWARERELPLLIIGRGSNLLIADAGFPGLVVRMAVRGIVHQRDDDAEEITAGAGEEWNTLVTHAVAHNLAGIECLAGIPGQVGATPIQNVGAYGQEVRDVIARVEALSLVSGEIVTFSNAECAFGYRESRFKYLDRGRYIILAVTFRLPRGNAPIIRYGEVDRQLAAAGIVRPTLADVRKAVLHIRRRKSMLLDGRDPNARSAGSFFLNPVVTLAEFAALAEMATPDLSGGEHLPGFAMSENAVKIPAAWLIEHAGFSRGYARGAVGLSANHTLALINRGGATAQEIVALAREIRARVHDRFGLRLQPEPALVGISLDEEEVVGR